MRVTIHPKYKENAALTTLVHRLPEAFAQNEGELLYDKRNQVRRFVLPDGLHLMVKQFHRPNIVQKLCYSTFWTNKAQKSYRFGNQLLHLGIGTPEPIAAVEYKKAGLIERYYFVSDEDTGISCEEALSVEDSCPMSAKQLEIIDALAHFLTELHDNGFLHGDANLSNFRLHQTEEGFSFAVIDTNRSKFLSHPASFSQRIKNLCRISHQRPIIQALAYAYAKHCPSDPEQTYQGILAATKRFEQHKARTRKLKKLFK